jgi:hypothetical protein
MPSCRHTTCDSTKSALNSGNVRCDRCDGIAECRHNAPESASGCPVARRSGRAVTRTDEIGSLTVCFETAVPVLTPRAARALLAILVELTEVPVLDGPGDEVRDGC